MEVLCAKEAVELLKSVRSSGVILEAGLCGVVVASTGGGSSEIRFDDYAETYNIVNRYLRKRPI